MAVGAFVTENLRRRLSLIDYAKQHPEVREERIDAPIIVIGMFRAGTTLLSHLLDQDPQNRSLLNWEAADNVPPPTPQTWRSGPRVEAVRAGLEMAVQMNPEMNLVHREEADGPTECITVDGAGLEEPDVGDAGERAQLRRVALHRRPSLGL